jgi:hypothetical protein
VWRDNVVESKERPRTNGPERKGSKKLVVITLGLDKRGLVLVLFSEQGVDNSKERRHEVVPRITSKLRIADMWDAMLSKVQNSWSLCEKGEYWCEKTERCV